MRIPSFQPKTTTTVAKTFPNHNPEDIPAMLLALNIFPNVGSARSAISPENRSEETRSTSYKTVAEAFPNHNPEDIPAMLLALAVFQK